MKIQKKIIELILILAFVFCLCGCPYNIFLQTKISVEGWLLIPDEYTQVKCNATHDDVIILDNEILPNLADKGDDYIKNSFVPSNGIYKKYKEGGWNLFYFTCTEKHFNDQEVYLLHLDLTLTSETKEKIESSQIFCIPYENVYAYPEMASLPEGSGCYVEITSDESDNHYEPYDGYDGL